MRKPILPHVEERQGHSRRIIIVDSGSTDSTASIAQSHGAKSLRKPGRDSPRRKFMPGQSQLRLDLVPRRRRRSQPELAAAIKALLKSRRRHSLPLHHEPQKPYFGKWIKRAGYILIPNSG